MTKYIAEKNIGQMILQLGQINQDNRRFTCFLISFCKGRKLVVSLGPAAFEFWNKLPPHTLKMSLSMHNTWNILKSSFSFNKVNDKLNGIWKISGYGILSILRVLARLLLTGILILNAVLLLVCQEQHSKSWVHFKKFTKKSKSYI